MSQESEKVGVERGESSEQIATVEEKTCTWTDLGVVDALCTACDRLKWKEPTEIQQRIIPLALQGKDVIGMAETGSGKTAAFLLPILQSLLESPVRLSALILAPTRELALQISKQFDELCPNDDLKCGVLVGGMERMAQVIVLAKRPHVLIATPGRLLDHLEATKGFKLSDLKYLVLDEADKILNMDFEVEVGKILKLIPRKQRRTYLFSATMTNKVKKLQRACLKDPVKIEVSTKYQTVKTLEQFYVFIPLKHKDIYLVQILKKLAGDNVMVFCPTRKTAIMSALILRHLGIAAIPLHGGMAQNKRVEVLEKFSSKKGCVLVTTDVASRGLDIPSVDVVINYDVPVHCTDYNHRVGRTARAGRSGKAITFVTQFDVTEIQEIERKIGQKLKLFETNETDALKLEEKATEARRKARKEKDSFLDKKSKKRKEEEDDSSVDEDDDIEAETAGTSRVRKRLKKSKK